MSMQLVTTVNKTTEAACFIAAPRRSDAIGLTLRAAYSAPNAASDPFDDLLAMLDAVPAVHTPR